MTIRQTLHHLNLRSTRLLPKFNKSIKIALILIGLIGAGLSVQKITAVEDNIPTSKEIDVSALSDYYSKQSAIDKGNNQEAWINESLLSNVISLNRAVAGDIPENPEDILGWKPGGLIGFTNNAIASLYQPPASGVQYIAHSVNSFLGKPAYAATGFGFNKLDGILTMWKTMRDAVYTLISLFFIIVGIMIMLRIKINPQTTVTIQSAIPKIISTLILVTFSYAISGLLIDLGNLLLAIILSLINQTDIGDVKTIMNWGFFDILWKVYGHLVSNTVTWVATAIGGLIGGAATVIAVGTSGLGWLLGGLAFALILLCLYIFAFIQIIKLFFGIAKSYIFIIIHAIISPIEIGMGAIPGSKINFSSWLNQIIAQIAVFPATTIFLVFSIFLVDTLKNNGLWSPNLFGSGGIISAIVGLACLVILSKIPQFVPEFIFKLKPSPLNQGVTDELKTIPGLGLFGTAASGVRSGIAHSIQNRIATRTTGPRGTPIAGRVIKPATRTKTGKGAGTGAGPLPTP